MLLNILERCLVENNNENYEYSIRNYQYLTNADNFMGAVIELETEFNSDNITFSHDYFEGQCLDSKIIAIEILD